MNWINRIFHREFRCPLEERRTEVVCLRTDCVNHFLDTFGCKLWRMVIGKDGKCVEYIKKQSEEK